jgi:hypothetical protein
MKKVVLFLGLALTVSITSCSHDESATPNPDQSNIQTKSNERVYKTMEEPVVGETIEVMEEEPHFDSMIEPQVGETYDVIGDDVNDKATYGKPVKLKIICKRESIGSEPGEYVGVGIDANGQHWAVTWDYSLNPDMTYTLKITGHKIQAGGYYPC